MKLKTVLLIMIFMSFQSSYGNAENISPRLYKVMGVAADDVLNIRAEPHVKGALIGSLPPEKVGLEVVRLSTDGKWALVGSGELSGWVTTQFLQQEEPIWKQGQLPPTLSCFGTEPFWSLNHADSILTLNDLSQDQAKAQYSIRAILDKNIDGDATKGVVASGETGRMTVVTKGSECSDGMSDRIFGITSTIILDGNEQKSRMLNGCCTLAR